MSEALIGADDLGDEHDILLGRRVVEIGPHTVTVRELTGEQTFAHDARLMGLARTLVEAHGEGDVAGDALLTLLADRREDAFALLAASTGEPDAWLRALPGYAVDLLLLHFVGLHLIFFAGRLDRLRQVAQVAARQAARQAAASGLPNASPDSSATGTPLTH